MDFQIFYKVLAKCITAYYFLKVGSLLLFYFVTHPFVKLVKDRPTPPKCLTDPKHGEHCYAVVNGIKLHYVEKGDHSKPLLVFVHGFPEFWYSWRYQLQEFSKDYWCVAIDNRGYGNSEKPRDSAEYKINNIVNDIKELVISLGREKFTLIGHDWGAVIAFRFVDLYGSMLDQFVAMSAPSGDVWVKMVFSEWWQFRHSWYVFFFQNCCLPEISVKLEDFAIFNTAMVNKDRAGPRSVTDEDIDAYKYTFGKKHDLTPPLNYYRTNFLDSSIMNRPPAEISTRGLFIVGENDEFISRGCIEAQKQRFSNLQTVLLKDARHFIQQEDPVGVNKLIRQFLKKN